MTATIAIKREGEPTHPSDMPAARPPASPNVMSEMSAVHNTTTRTEPHWLLNRKHKTVAITRMRENGEDMSAIASVNTVTSVPGTQLGRCSAQLCAKAVFGHNAKTGKRVAIRLIRFSLA